MKDQRKGRPRLARFAPYNPALMEVVRERMSAGETLRKIAPTLGVHRTAILAWVAEIPEAADHYAKAREWQAEAHADEIVHAADELLGLARKAAAGEIELSQGAVNAYRSAIDALKWQASKLRPKVYGDKLDIALEQATTLVLLDYARSEPLPNKSEHDAIDVTPLPALAANAEASRAAPRKTRAGGKVKAGSKRRGGRG